MATPVLSDDVAAMMLQKVRRDVSLSLATRNRFRREVGPVPAAQALGRAQAFAEHELQQIPRTRPSGPLARVVSVGTYLKYMTRPETRDAFTTPEDYAQYIGTSEDPDRTLTADLKRGTVFPWTRSWLAESLPLRGMDAAAIVQALEIRPASPLIVLELSLPALRAAGVTVRPPCSLDALMGPNPQWRPGGPASGIREFVDGDVEAAAITSVRWVES